MHRTYFRTFTTTAAMVLVSFLLIGAAFGFASRQVFVSEARESMMTNSREISRMAVVYAAEGKLAPADIPAILDSANRTLAGPTVPPGGLYMTQLWYDEDVL